MPVAQQANLFEPAAATLVDDAEGGVRYLPAVVPLDWAERWMRELHERVDWRSERRPMYERVVDVPRLMASFDLASADAPAVLRAALAALRVGVPGLARVPFTHVGLNLYRDGRDSVALHNDRLHNLAPGEPIALLSLGAAREMLIHAKQGTTPNRRVLLQPGSALVMSHASQVTHEHGIPKTSAAVGPRISLAFRVRRVEPAANAARW